MAGFSDDAPEPEPDPLPETEFRGPAWMGPPSGRPRMDDKFDALRLGLEYADGRKAFGGGWFVNSDEEGPRGPVLMERGGSGGDRSWTQAYWLWPIPPPGEIAIVIAWPSFGVEETRIALDADVIREAAGRSEALWPDDRAPMPSVDDRGRWTAIPPIQLPPLEVAPGDESPDPPG